MNWPRNNATSNAVFRHFRVAHCTNCNEQRTKPGNGVLLIARAVIGNCHPPKTLTLSWTSSPTTAPTQNEVPPPKGAIPISLEEARLVLENQFGTTLEAVVEECGQAVLDVNKVL